MWATEAQMNRLSELASRVLPELADMLPEANSSDNANKMAQRLLSSGKLYRTFETSAHCVPDILGLAVPLALRP